MGEDDQPRAAEGGPDAEERAREASGAKTRHRSGSFWRELPILVVVALGLALLIKAFLVQAFYIPSGSMEDTLKVGDRVLVNKVVYRLRDVRRGEVVVFNGLDSFTPEVDVPPPRSALERVWRAVASAIGVAPPGERDFIKRVIAVPGDTVRCCDGNGRVVVNGRPLDEPYLFPGDLPSEEPFGPLSVPPGRLWVMGDHRSASADSRSHLDDPGGGTVPADRVIGRAFVIVWPAGRFATLPVPDTFAATPRVPGAGR